MLGVDTNVLIRYLVEDDPEQTRLARNFLMRTCTQEAPGFVNHVVLSEVVWLLGRGYHYDKASLVKVLISLLDTVELIIEDIPTVRAALYDFEGGSAGFVDYFIARKNQASGCAYTVTFDRKASRHALFRLLGEA